MPIQWGNIASGAGKGAIAGTAVAPGIGTAIGGVIGGIGGAFSRDIDKGVTGKSGSGTTNNVLNLAAILGAGKLASGAMSSGGSGGGGFLSNLFQKGGSTSGTSPMVGSSYPGSVPPPPPPGGSSFGGNVPSYLNSNQLSYQNSLQGANKGLGFSGMAGKAQSNPLLTGLGTMAASQLIKSPSVPELPQSVIDFQNAAKAGNPLQNQAASSLQQQLGQTQQNLGEDEIAAINRQYDLAQEQELKQIDAMYKSLRPGTDPMTDSSYQKDIGLVRDRYATLRADSQAGAQRQISNDFSAQRANQIAQAAGLGQQQLQQLSTLSQYDLDRQLSQLNIDYQDKSTLRNYLLQLGGNIAASGYQQNPLSGYSLEKTGV